MPLELLISLAALSFVISVVMTGGLRKVGHKLARLDHPNERSLHDTPTPRTGGLAVLAATTTLGGAVALHTGAAAEWAWIAAGAFLVAAVSFVDDRIEVSPAVRLLVHLTASALVCLGIVRLGGSVLAPVPDVLVLVATVLGLTWATNLFNFMDGLDGFAGGMTAIGFGAYGWMAWDAGALTVAGVCIVIAAAACGFLVFNKPVAQIFMGDAGASTLGFLAGSIGLLGARDGVWPWQAAALIFSPFLVDSSVTLARRLARGEKVWLPHRTHYYQRLVRAGWSHRRTLAVEYLLMLSCAATAIAAVERGWPWNPVLASWSAGYVACICGVRAVESRHAAPPRALHTSCR